MSAKGKKKGVVSISLAYSLTIGTAETDKVKIGGWFEKRLGENQLVTDIRSDYTALTVKHKQIVEDLKSVPPELQGELPTRRQTLEQGLGALEQREVNNDKVSRDAMIEAIKIQADEADSIIDAIIEAKRLASLPAPVISSADAIDVTAGDTITLKLFGAKAVPALSLRLEGRRTPLPDDAIFLTAGARSLLIICDATTTTRRAEKVVTVNVKPRRRVITWSPPTEIAWGTVLTLKSLRASATGEGPAPEIIPPEGLFPLVGANTLKIKAAANAEAGWSAAEETATITVVKVKRSITWSLADSYDADTVLNADVLGAKLWDGEEADDSESTATLTVTAPKGGRLAKPGKAVTVTIEAKGTDTHGAASLSGTVEVVLAVPGLTWALPEPVALDEDGRFELGALQLNAAIDPEKLEPSLVYAPSSGTKITAEGVRALKVSFPGDTAYETAAAATRLTVVQDQKCAEGMKAMNNGSAFVPPEDEPSKARLKEWAESDGNDPKALGTMGKSVMAKISTMTPLELVAYFETMKADSTVSTYVDKPGKKILSFKNGLEVRYKPRGSNRNGNKPSMCMEVRMDPSLLVSTGQDQVAFKVSITGKPAAKSGKQRNIPDTVKGRPARKSFDKGAMAATHLLMPS